MYFRCTFGMAYVSDVQLCDGLALGSVVLAGETGM